MGDIIDDFLDIRDGFSNTKQDFASLSDEFSDEQRGIREIWDPARFECKPQLDHILCLHTKVPGCECSLCEDICPAQVLTVGANGLSIDGKDCIGCGLCTAVCPTGALVSPRIEPKAIYNKVARNAVTKEAAYVTCARALDHTPPEGVTVLPCLGVMREELWFSLLAAYNNVAIYLPLNTCDTCPCKVGEGLFTEAVSTAEKWARETLGFECDEAELKVGRTRQAERDDLMRDVLKSTVGLASITNPIARTAGNALQSFNKSREQLSRMQGLLDKACGGQSGSGQQVRLTLDANRQLLLLALRNYPDLAGGFKVVLSKTGEECTGSGECVKACPMGARRLKDGVAQVISTYCVGCGLCIDVCPSGAAVLRRRSAKVLLQELSGIEKGIDSLKGKTAGAMSAIKDTVIGDSSDR